MEYMYSINFYDNYSYFSDVFFDPKFSTIHDYMYTLHCTIHEPSKNLLFSVFLCLIIWGLLGIVFLQSNYILIMVSIEIMLLGFGLLFSFISLYRSTVDGFLFTIVIQTVAAGEAAVGLSLLIALSNRSVSPQFEMVNLSYQSFISNNSCGIFSFIYLFIAWFVNFFKVIFVLEFFSFLFDLLVLFFFVFFFSNHWFLVDISGLFFFSGNQYSWIGSIVSIFDGFCNLLLVEYLLNYFFFCLILFILCSVFFSIFYFFSSLTINLVHRLFLGFSGFLLLITIIILFLVQSCTFAVREFIICPVFLLGINVVLDSYSFFFFFLTSYIIFICFCLVRHLIKDVREQLIVYFFLYLAQFILVIGFLTENLLIFWVSFESVSVPLIYFICRWGSRARKELATYYLVLYTIFGGFLFLFSLLYIYTIVENFSLSFLLQTVFSLSDQKYLWWLFLITFAIKIPIIPFHLWLPEAHVEASTIGSILLAGLVLKLGGYGFLRFSTVLFPEAHSMYYVGICVWALLSAMFAGFMAIRQIDLKKLIAYASVAHMSFGTAALFAYNLQSVTGGILLLIGHSFTASGLFLLVGFLYVRYGVKYYGYYSGLYTTMPIFSFFTFFFFLASISFPGTLNFVGEILVIIGLAKEFFGMFIILLLIFFCIIINLIYILLFYTRLVMGVNYIKITKRFFDLTNIEIFLCLLLLIPIYYLGLFPNTIFSIIQEDYVQINLIRENKLLYW